MQRELHLCEVFLVRAWLRAVIRYIVKSLRRQKQPTICSSGFTIRASRVSFSFQGAPEPSKWIEEFIHNSFLQWNDSVVRNLNAFGANLRATLGDVAVTDSISIPQFLEPILRIERVHLQSGDMNQKSRPNKF